MPTALITETLDPACADWLAERCDVVWAKADGRDDGAADALDAHLPTADALVVRTYTQVNDALLDKAPNLKVVGRAGVGLDNIDVAACRARGVEVVYTPDANTQAVVEYVFGLMLDWARPRTDLPAHPEGDAARFHQLRKTEVGKQLDQLTLGILGFGRIGKRIGAVAKSVGMGLKVLDLLPEAEMRKAVAYPFEWIEHSTQWAKCHVVTLHTDGRPRNKHLIDAAWLEQLRDDVLLINAARGMLVDQSALAAWAAAHPDARVVLDVLDPEPPAADEPLRGLPDVRILPHLASRTHEALANMSWVVRDVARVLEGDTPQCPAP